MILTYFAEFFILSVTSIGKSLARGENMARKKSLPEGMRYLEKRKCIEYRFTVEQKRYSVYGQTAKECYEKAKAKEKELSEGQYKKGKVLTISEYFERWIKRKTKAKETTIRTNKILFNIASGIVIDGNGNTFGNLKIIDIENQHIEDVKNGMLRAGKSTRTVNDTVSLIKRILQSAVDKDRIIGWNPARGVDGIDRKEPLARDTYHRALSKKETRKFLQTAKERNSWYYNLYCFLVDTGCRCGEAGALMNADISGQIIHVSRTVTRTAEGTYRIGDEAKTKAGTRDIPINPLARQAIDNQRAVNRMLGDGVTAINDTVFKSPRGGLLSDTCVNQDIARICKAAGIEKFTAHAFRATFITRCVESGMQPKTLQEIVGHKDISQTMNLYAHCMEETKISQMQAVKII